MTLANQISFTRLLLIPVFVCFATSYSQSLSQGNPVDLWRWGALVTFGLAAVSDGLDGLIARRFRQQSELGALLDPLADKGLMLAAILTLSVTNWPGEFPLWFPLLVITRDVLCILAYFVILHHNGRVEVRAHWTGKVTTATQLTAIGWVLLGIDTPPALWPTVLAGVFTFISGMIYLSEAFRQLQDPRPEES
ncbi:MAG: CDP-alcohol phosphatidyltransferase family protein [Verrucomicrobiota bacterium]